MSRSSRIIRFLVPLFLFSGPAAWCQDTADAEPVSPDRFVLRTLPDSLVHRWKSDPSLAYANDPAYWHKDLENPESHPFLEGLLSFLASKGFVNTLYVLLGALLIYAILRIMKDNNVSLFYRSAKKRRALSDSGSPAEETGEDLSQRLQHFIRIGDYRQATRYLYLITLTRLNEKGLIRWHREATNQEYLLQLKDSPLESSFRYLTGIYDRVWYGEFPLGETQFNRLHKYFEDFYKIVPA